MLHDAFEDLEYDELPIVDQHFHVEAAFGASLPEVNDVYEFRNDAIFEANALAESYYGEETKVTRIHDMRWFAQPHKDAMGGITISVYPCTSHECEEWEAF